MHRILASIIIFLFAVEIVFAQSDVKGDFSVSVNGVSLDMIYVEGGSFSMGYGDGNSDENTVHSVALGSYHIGKYEVTQKLWKAVMGSLPEGMSDIDSKFVGDDLPVVYVSWNDVQSFVNKLNSITLQNFRLPTEAEREFAARGGVKSVGYKYSGSNNLDDVAWYGANSDGKPHPVGTKSPNELGIYDMSGNVWEWCQDWYHSDYYAQSPAKNPCNEIKGAYRVVRGGSLSDDADFLRVTLRTYGFPDGGDFGLGFRLALPSSDSKPSATKSSDADRQVNSPILKKTASYYLEMVYVEGGTFSMGATSEHASDAYEDEKPVHNVTLDSYHIGKYEVTQKLWKAVMGSLPEGMSGLDSRFVGDNLPVVCVSWNGAQDFIQKLNVITSQKYRLPTEAEWEYAARGGNKGRGFVYSGSNNIDEVAWYNEKWEKGRPHPVGSKSPNELGIYDMSGNVWEWCQDWYGADYYAQSPAKNPCNEEGKVSRVPRGGGWYGNDKSCRVSIRYYYNPDDANTFLGLRLVRE